MCVYLWRHRGPRSEQTCPPNELVIRLQPKEAIYMKTNVKAPGLKSQPTQAELDLSYHVRYPDVRDADSPWASAWTCL